MSEKPQATATPRYGGRRATRSVVACRGATVPRQPRHCPGLGRTCPRQTLLLTADTEGHVGPCQDCPDHPGLGGLLRRATVVSDLRQKTPALLLLDAGNGRTSKPAVSWPRSRRPEI